MVEGSIKAAHQANDDHFNVVFLILGVWGPNYRIWAFGTQKYVIGNILAEHYLYIVVETSIKAAQQANDDHLIYFLFWGSGSQLPYFGI